MRYWEERAKEWAKARDKKEHKINAALVDSYKNAADDLQKEIAAWYEKYADAEGISFADAKKRLDERERRALTRSVKAFEKLAKQNKDHSQDKILTRMSAAVHINRLTSMQFQMRYILYELYSDVNNELADGLKEFYADEREQMAYEAQMARGRFEPIATIDEKRISAVLKTPWATDGKDFSARLWNNREQLVSTLQSELTRALITGADSASVAKTVVKKMNAAQYAASRLVSTEITRIITASDIDTFAEMDIDEVEVVGTLDLHTCDTCGDMDGKHMPRSEAKAGTTAPPFHPNCRCVIVPYFGDNEDARATRNPETGKTETAPAMTFKEWKEKYGSGETMAQGPAKSGIILSEIGDIIIDSRKFTEYALNPEQAPDKANAFKLALGYDLSNWQDLKKQVLEAIKNARAFEKKEDQYGKRYEVIVQIMGANGKEANVLTGWIKDNESGEIRLTSIYVTKKKVKV